MNVPMEMAGLRQVNAIEDEHPFRHWIIDDLFDADMIRDAEASFDGHLGAPGWVNYCNHFESKQTFNILARMPDEVRRCVYEWNTTAFARQLTDLTGISGLYPDERMWGGGMHVMFGGDFLKPHLDHSHNPNGLERRLSMIVFLNSNWQDSWEGAFEMWSNAGQWSVKKVPVRFNRMVLFEGGVTAWHGVPIPLKCPEGTMRKTIALYYLAYPRPGVVRRDRAQFVAPFDMPALAAEALGRASPRVYKDPSR